MRVFDEDGPVAVLLSDEPQSGDGWLEVRSHACGGFACNYYDGYAFILPLLADQKSLINAIAFERFCALETCLDYEVTSEDRVAYKAFLVEHGLSVSDEILADLTQAIYPLDASSANLEKLTGLTSLPGIDLTNLRIAVLGDNCD